MNVNVVSLNGGYHRHPNQFSVELIKRAQINNGRVILGRKIAAAFSGPIGLVELGRGGVIGTYEVAQTVALRERKIVSEFLPAIGPDEADDGWLRQAADRIDWTKFAGLDVALFGMEKMTGRTIAAARGVVSAKLGILPTDIRTACLIEHTPGTHPLGGDVGLDFCVFRVRGGLPNGVLFGRGMDLDDEYRGIESVWYTLREPNGRFRKPRPHEVPDVYMIGEDGNSDLLGD